MAVPAQVVARRSRRVVARREARWGLLFVLPAFLLFLAFRFGPAIAGLVLGFMEYAIGGEAEWTGLENARRLVDDPVFWQSLRVTVVYTLLYVPLTVVTSVGLALLVRRGFRGVGFFRSVFFLPVVTSLVLVATIFAWVFSAEGPWSRILGWLGLPDESWLASSTLVLPALALVGVWSHFGYGMLIVLARLQDLPREQEEAALTDGAGPWQRFRWIVLPQLRPVLFFLLVIETTASFQVFDLVYAMTGGGPARGSYTLVMALYDQGFKYFDLGYASAIGVALFVMTLVVALIQRLALGRDK
ncbi:sugar ABC transporter permease [Micromonospora echinospora]|uniref:Carbohydrate ABC transporter membrane protein 1, CUT1 family n=1 Tax=Micromonospora echinospora TaxID=1877 RepID=A0A1C4ZRA2_MICEC|nr:sugar ABC transporter permease [Micromonospora echinospora]OZV81844.1 sugar ABC transporter permease [Micromonospora echinospora]SCF35291.1 carbohydrate ABC transporter membrane protein 1, CUT1 family [Micromonospora echinospora]